MTDDKARSGAVTWTLYPGSRVLYELRPLYMLPFMPSSELPICHSLNINASPPYGEIGGYSNWQDGQTDGQTPNSNAS